MGNTKTDTKEEYPEHAKLKALGSLPNEAGDFLEWLKSRYSICEWSNTCSGCETLLPLTAKTCPKCTPEKSTEQLGVEIALGIPQPPSTVYGPYYFESLLKTTSILAEYFRIDEQKLNDEKERMLEKQRELNSSQGKKI
jgi:hypothetical protein